MRIEAAYVEYEDDQFLDKILDTADNNNNKKIGLLGSDQ